MTKRNAKILQAGLIVGTLDILSAFIYYFIKSGKTNFLVIFKFIASGIFGKAAGDGGTGHDIGGVYFALCHRIFLHCLFLLVISKSKCDVKKQDRDRSRLRTFCMDVDEPGGGASVKYGTPAI